MTVTRASDGGPIGDGIGLGPMAVAPARQRQQVGTALVNAGLEELARVGHRFVVVLGHPAYYPRFGFVPASRHGLRWEHRAPDVAFMVRELLPGGLDGVAGIVRYHAAFAAASAR